MAKLYRPYIPLKVRVQVAARQLRATNPQAFSTLYWLDDQSESDGRALKVLLDLLFGDRPCALDHDPALVNRRRYQRNAGAEVRYDPPANDLRFLIYREAGPVGGGSEHDIKTRVRGERGQHSDLALARKAKRRAKKLGRKSKAFRDFERRFDRGDPSTIDQRATALINSPKRTWPSRPFPKRAK